MTQPIIELALSLEHVAVGYGRRVVLPDVNLASRAGALPACSARMALANPPSSKLYLGILPPVNGRIVLHPVAGRPLVLGYMPQRESLDPIYPLSSFEVVLMGVCGRVKPGFRIAGVEKDWAHQCLRETGADQLSRKLFSELSGGQKQRILMARALATRPDILLLDEPTAGIDAVATNAIMELLEKSTRRNARRLSWSATI